MNNSKGQILVISVLFLSTIVLLIAVLISFFYGNNYFVQKRYEQKIAFNLSEAGIEKAINELNSDANFTGETINLANGTFVTTVTPITSKLSQVESTGYYPSQANPKNQKTTRIQIEINTVDVAFHYGVQVGEGGLEMKNNSTIFGNIYSNGSITGSGEIQGTAQVATDSQLGTENTNVKDAQESFGHDSTETDLAQSFQSPGSAKITMLSINLKKVCEDNRSNKCPAISSVSVVGNIPNLSGPADDEPDTSNVIASGSLDPILASMDDFGWINIVMDTPADLTQDEIYWFIIDQPTGGDSERHWIATKDGTDSGYGEGVAKYTSDWEAASPSWTKIDGDLNFKVYLATGSTYIDGPHITEDAYAYEIKNATIDQDAYYMIIDVVSTVSGSVCPNANCHSDTAAPGLKNLPISDANIADWKNDALAGGVYKVCSNDLSQVCIDDSECGGETDTCNASSYTLDGSNGDIGPIKIEGDLTAINNAELKITGTIWVTGNIILDNNAKIFLDPNYGGLSGLVLNDGEVDVSNNVFFCGSGYSSGPTPTCDTSGGSYVMFISSKAATDPTDPPVIDVDNNATAVIFYAHQGAIKLHNNAGVFEATAYKLILEENATVTYESGLADANFSSGPGASWMKKEGTWQEL